MPHRQAYIPDGIAQPLCPICLRDTAFLFAWHGADPYGADLRCDRCEQVSR